MPDCTVSKVRVRILLYHYTSISIISESIGTIAVMLSAETCCGGTVQYSTVKVDEKMSQMK